MAIVSKFSKRTLNRIYKVNELFKVLYSLLIISLLELRTLDSAAEKTVS